MTIIPGAWMMGGYYSKAPYWMGAGGWISGVLALYQLFRDKGLRSGNPALNRVWILWLGFLAYLGVSLWNASYRRIDLPGGSTYTRSDFIEWLPSVIAAEVSAPMILQLTGSLVLAWSLLAVLRNRKVVCLLLGGLVLNAFALSAAGAYFKVTGAENILNYFAAVNPKFYASFTYHNHWVAFAGFHLFLATGLLVRFRHKDRLKERLSNQTGLMWVACFFIFLSLFLVESRTGLLVAVLYLGFLGYYLVRVRFEGWVRTPWFAALALVVLLALGWVSYQIVLPQLSNTAERVGGAWSALFTEKEVDKFRFDAGPKITARLIEDKPVLGWGWGSYPFAMSIFAGEYIDGMAQFAHNDWLQFVSELGILGFFLLVFPVVHMSAYFKHDDALASIKRWGIVLLLFIAFFEGPFTNPVVLATVLVVICTDLSVKRRESNNR